MNIEKILIDEERYDYKCFDILKEKLQDSKFRSILEDGIKEGKIQGFTKDIWQKIMEQNVRINSSFDQMLKDGMNIGCCTPASKQLSFSFDNVYICGGTLPLLAGTQNCPDGRHTWILYKNTIIDTSLMLLIDASYQDKIGYNEENRYNPMEDPRYCAAKEMTNDPSLRPKKK